MNPGYIVEILIVAALILYLGYVLIWPERF